VIGTITPVRFRGARSAPSLSRGLLVSKQLP